MSLVIFFNDDEEEAHEKAKMQFFKDNQRIPIFATEKAPCNTN